MNDIHHLNGIVNYNFSSLKIEFSFSLFLIPQPVNIDDLLVHDNGVQCGQLSAAPTQLAVLHILQLCLDTNIVVLQTWHRPIVHVRVDNVRAHRIRSIDLWSQQANSLRAHLHHTGFPWVSELEPARPFICCPPRCVIFTLRAPLTTPFARPDLVLIVGNNDLINCLLVIVQCWISHLQHGHPVLVNRLRSMANEKEGNHHKREWKVVRAFGQQHLDPSPLQHWLRGHQWPGQVVRLLPENIASSGECNWWSLQEWTERAPTTLVVGGLGQNIRRCWAGEYDVHVRLDHDQWQHFA